MSQPNTLEWRMAQLEKRVETLGSRTHELAGFATENRLNIQVIKNQMDKTADKDDMERLEREMTKLDHTMTRIGMGIGGALGTLTVSLIVFIATH